VLVSNPNPDTSYLIHGFRIFLQSLH
jgi:hypothetical protein